MNDLPNPFAYAPLEVEDTPLPEKFFGVTADKNQWFQTVIEIQLLEYQRQGIPVNPVLYKQVNTMFGDYTGIFATELSIVFEHKAYDIIAKQVDSIDAIREIWKDASETGKRIALYNIAPVYANLENLAMVSSLPEPSGYIIRMTYVR